MPTLTHTGSTVDARIGRWLDRLNATGGFTVSPVTGNYAVSGYAVSVNPECERQIQGRVSIEDIRDYAYTHAAALVQSGKYLGAWRDPDTGITYLDVSTIVHSNEQARSLARQHDQLAFYDLARKITIDA